MVERELPQMRSEYYEGLNRDQAVQIRRLNSGESFVSKKEVCIQSMRSLILFT